MDLTISPTKTEGVVFHGEASQAWHVGSQLLPVSVSFNYLGIIFHESGSMTPGSGPPGAEWQWR